MRDLDLDFQRRTPESANPTRVVLACSGLDHARRGFESFARECFNALVATPGLSIELVKGSGPPRPREHAVLALTRHAPLARLAARLWGREPFRVEQVAFALSLQAPLARAQPDVVYFSEWHTGLALAFVRTRLRQRFSLAYCNGAMATTGFGHLDHVQQLTPVALETVLRREPVPSRHVLLPLGHEIPETRQPISAEDRRALRQRLSLPAEARILLSVAALNRHHKRLDYLIDEVGSLPEPRPFVLLVGAEEAETPGLRALASERLGAGGFAFRTVSHSAVADLYEASDVFVLTSTGEAFGRVFVEALAHGLPCLAHDYPVSRHVLSHYGDFADFAVPGSLARLVSAGGRGREPGAERARHRHAFESFSWTRLRPRYVEFLQQAAKRTVSSSRGDEVSRKNW